MTVYLVGLEHRYFKLVVKLQKDLNNNSPIMGRATDSTQNQRQFKRLFKAIAQQILVHWCQAIAL